jgi:hypothetical protein
MLAVTIEDVLEVASGHELVDHEPVLPVGAVADQRHQVGVVEPAQDVDLHPELALAVGLLRGGQVHLLDGNDLHSHPAETSYC